MVEEELYRLEAISSLPKEYNQTLEDISKQFNNEIGRHEAMDRSFIVSEQIEDYLLNHPYIIFRPECYKLAFQARELLAELYQRIENSDFNG